MNTFRFRAESQQDVDTLLELLPKDKVLGVAIICRDPLPDVTVDLVVNLTFESLRDYMSGVEDGHVMRETVLPKALYTGIRFPL